MIAPLTEEERAALRAEQKHNRALYELEQITQHARYLLESDTLAESIDTAHGEASDESRRQYDLCRVRLLSAVVRLTQIRQAGAPIETAWEAMDDLFYVLTYTTQQLTVHR